MAEAFISDAIRTPIGRFGGSLVQVRADDLAAITLRFVMARSQSVAPERIEEVFYGCAKQAGEDNRNVAQMRGSGWPDGADDRRRRGQHNAISVRDGQGGEGLPAISRPRVRDHRWALRRSSHGGGLWAASMPETAENVPEADGVSRADQDAYALQANSARLRRRRVASSPKRL